MAETEIPADVRERAEHFAMECGHPWLAPVFWRCIMADRAAHAPDPSREMLAEALRRIASTLTYPVSTEIDPRGWRLHSPNEDRNTFAAETAIEASHDRS